MIPYGKQTLFKKDIRKVVEVLSSPFLTQGPNIASFEKKFAAYCGAKYAVAVSNGTAGLHLACAVLDLKPGDEGITSPMTFAASANCLIYCKATPIFADIELETGNISPKSIEASITQKTKVLIPVHYAGLPADMAAVQKIAKKRKFYVIEDACHALGATYQGKRVGSCEHSDICVFSFHPVKHITTGEGGMITTNSKQIYDRLVALRSHGVYRKKNWAESKGGWYYEMRELGFNYRITDFQCALGESQLDSLDLFLQDRKKIAHAYHKKLGALRSSLRLPALDYPDKTHAWHLFVIQILPEAKLDRKKLYSGLREAGISPQVHYIPVYDHPFYKKHFPRAGKKCPKADKFYKNILSLPMFPQLTVSEQSKVTSSLSGLLR